MSAVLEPRFRLATDVGHSLKENFKNSYTQVATNETNEQKLVASYVGFCLGYFKQTIQEIGNWSVPNENTHAPEYWLAFSCWSLADVLNDILKDAVSAVHQSESKNLAIPHADELIKAQQKAEKILHWFEKNWDTNRTKQLLHNPPKLLSDAELIPIDEVLANLGK